MSGVNTLITVLLLLSPVLCQSDTQPVKIRFLGSYRHNGLPDGNLWHNVLVPKYVTKDQLIAVAKALFKDAPGYYRFFTDDKEFQAFVDSDLHYLRSDKPDYPFPEKWFNRSCVATINRHSSRGYLGEWALYAEGITGQRFASSPQDEFIISLGKPDKPIQ
jgi:hypothetical protein